MPSPTAATWVKFFTNADIPSPAAATYAHVFVENRIQMDMLMDLNKEYLREMGITTMGDIIAILRHARKVHEQSARDRVLSVPEQDAGVPVATVSATPSTVSVSNGKKTEKTGITRTVSATTATANSSKPRRVLPEHEGKYKITLPSGNTPRSREILDKKAQDAKPTSNAKVTSSPRAGTKRACIFDRLNSDNEQPASKQVSKPLLLDQITSPISSSIFARLGDRKVSDLGPRTTSQGILKAGVSNGSPAVALPKIPPSQQKVILVKKMPAKAALPSSDEDEMSDYLTMGGVGASLKSVSFSEEDEVLEIAPRRPQKLTSSQAGRLRFNEKEVSVKQRLGGGGLGNSPTVAHRSSSSLHGTKKVVQMKPSSKVSPAARTGLKSDFAGGSRGQPIKTRLSLGSQTVSTRQIVKRVERFSLDSKITKSSRNGAAINNSVFDRLGYNRK